MIIIRNSRLPKVKKKTDIPQPQNEVITYRMTIITGGDQKIYYQIFHTPYCIYISGKC